MDSVLPVWAAITVAVIIGVVKLLFTRADEKDEDSLHVTTNPDDPDGVADFNERERLREPGELPPES